MELQRVLNTEMYNFKYCNLDEKAHTESLDNEFISGANLDVYREKPYRGLFTSDYDMITALYIGAYAKDIRIQKELEKAQNLINGLENENESK